MAQDHHVTADEDRIPLVHKLAYGAGAFVNNLLASAIGGMSIVLNLGLGMNPADVGKLAALPRLLDALTDPLMGYISDNTRSRWGRRRPYIFCGAIAVGIVFALLWQLPEGRSDNFYYWFFLIGSLLFYVAYTVFATPWVALGYELTPDYHERTRLMGVQNAMGQVAYAVAPWFLAFMYSETLFDGVVEGAAWLAIGIGALAIVIGVLPAIFLRERYQEVAEAEVAAHAREKRSLGAVVGDFARGFLITLSFKPFLMLCAATFLVFNGFILVSAFQSYVIIFYVFGGDEAQAAQYIGLSGTVGAVSTFAVIALVTWLSTFWGKRRTFFAAIGVSVVGYASKWFCYHPDYPLLVLLPAPLMAFGLGGLFTLMPSMIADVCDLDELKTGERREGMYGSIFWWVVKLGMSVALLGGGYLLNYTGFDVELGGAQTAETIRQMRMFDAGIPALASVVAIWMVWAYPITEERAYEVRESLEARRGTAGEPVPA